MMQILAVGYPSDFAFPHCSNSSNYFNFNPIHCMSKQIMADQDA